METEDLPTLLDAATEGVPEAADNERMSVHRVCRTCHRELRLGVPAICGVKLLGNYRNVESNCADCLKLTPAHRLSHLLGRG